MPGRYVWHDPDDEFTPAPAELTVEVTERQIVGQLLGPDGSVLSSLLDRPEMPYGFFTGCREPGWWRRS